tara:strand:+ start:345 stop:578 length:234 start_codon:yes stop_codon:yes gene_type:complete
MTKTKVKIEEENEILMNNNSVLQNQIDALEKALAKQQLQIQILEQYANAVLNSGQQLLSNIEALNKTSGDEVEQNRG